MNAQTSILVGCSNEMVWIRVEGKGSFLNSSGVKEFAKEMINRRYREFVIDLAKCPAMDSTFMGTMAGIALRLRELNQGSLRVININERCHDLLKNLGLDQLFSIGDAMTVSEPENGTLAPASLGTEADRLETTKIMIEAHQALVDVSPENLPKFKDVLDFLKHDLHHEVGKQP